MINKLSTARAINDIGRRISEGRDAAAAVAEHGATIEGADAKAALEVAAQTVDALATRYDGDEDKMARALRAIAVVVGSHEGSTIDVARLEGIKRSIADGLIPVSATLRADGECKELTLADLAESGLPTTGLFDVDYDTEGTSATFLRFRRRLDHPSIARSSDVVRRGTLTIEGGQIKDLQIDRPK